MKFLINFIVALMLSMTGYSQLRVSDVYLQRKPVNDYTYITIDAQTGHRMLTTAFCCGNFGPDDLKIVCAPQDGVYVSGSNMHVEDYFETALIDPWCPSKEYELGYKDEVFLESQGNQFPYCKTSATTYSICADPIEWDSLTHYGTPPTSLAFAPYLTNVQPSFDCATGVTKGREDCYSYNPKFDLDAAGVPQDATLILEVAINLPPNNPFDPGVYPNDYKRLCHIQGTNFTWTTQMPPAPLQPSAPTGVQAQTNPDKKSVTISWTQAGTVTEWVVQKQYAVGNNAGMPSGPVMTATTNPYSYTPGKGKWKFVVKAVNCPTESIGIVSNIVQVTK